MIANGAPCDCAAQIDRFWATTPQVTVEKAADVFSFRNIRSDPAFPAVLHQFTASSRPSTAFHRISLLFHFTALCSPFHRLSSSFPDFSLAFSPAVATLQTLARTVSGLRRLHNQPAAALPVWHAGAVSVPCPVEAHNAMPSKRKPAGQCSIVDAVASVATRHRPALCR